MASSPLCVSYRQTSSIPADDPTTISVMMLALDDSETRLTPQSLEEQYAAAATVIRQRAASLGASTADDSGPADRFQALRGFEPSARFAQQARQVLRPRTW